MATGGSGSASTMDLLSRHREARKQLSRSYSAGPEGGTRPRPASATSYRQLPGQPAGQRYACAVAAAARHFAPGPAFSVTPASSSTSRPQSASSHGLRPQSAASSRGVQSARGEGHLVRVESFRPEALSQVVESPVVAGSVEGEFTQEELQLEREIAFTLTSLEAVEAAVMALQAQYQVATEDAEQHGGELLQLKDAFAKWEKATDDGQKELEEREASLAELLKVLPENLWQEYLGQQMETEQKLSRAQERVSVLEKQTNRLKDEVASKQAAHASANQDRKNAEKQFEVLTTQREARMNEQREARQDLKELEELFSDRKAAADMCDTKRKALGRENVKLRAEAGGLRISHAAAVARLQAAEEAAAADASARAELLRIQAAAVPREGTHSARAVSLSLQRMIVKLWEELKVCNEKAQELTVADLPGAPEPGLAVSEGLSGTRTLGADALRAGTAF